MMDAWLAFARSGNPSHPGIPSWLPYDPSARETLVFDASSTLSKDPLAAERVAWDGFL
jgi:para-nitrobenzyl esterase